jgi:hypothetical protein
MSEENIVKELNKNGSIYLDVTNTVDLNIFLDFINKNYPNTSIKIYILNLLNQNKKVDINLYKQYPYIRKSSGKNNDLCFCSDRGENYLGAISELINVSLNKVIKKILYGNIK